MITWPVLGKQNVQALPQREAGGKLCSQALLALLLRKIVVTWHPQGLA